MKLSPTDHSKPVRKKYQYLVTIDGEEYPTWAYNEEGALSNAAYRYGDEHDEEVGRVMWMTKHGDLDYEVVEL